MAGNRTKTCQTNKTKNTENWSINSKIRNKIMKTYNGNRRSNISVMHWNLGPKELEQQEGRYTTYSRSTKT